MSLLIFYVLLAVTVSFCCSVMEATLLSVNNSYIKNAINHKKKYGNLLAEYKKNIDRPLAGILTLNTIANTLGATGAGAQAGKVFGNQWVGLFAILLTFSILVFSEIIPKTIGAVYWRKTAPITAYTLKYILILLHPFIVFSQYLTSILNPSGNINPKVLREEISVMAEIGEDIGALSDWEEKLISNILKLDKIKVKEILTPRTVMLSFPCNFTVREVLKEKPNLPFSRIPIYKGDPDHIVGIVLRSDILASAAKDQHDKKLIEMKRDIYSIPPSLSIARAIELFITRREHIFLVVDEYGGTEGIVTLEDAMEALLGSEIVDEKDFVVDMRELALRMWQSKRQKGMKKFESM